MKLANFWVQDGWLYYETDNGLKGYVKLATMLRFSCYTNKTAKHLTIHVDIDLAGGLDDSIQFIDRRTEDQLPTQVENLFKSLEKNISSQ